MKATWSKLVEVEEETEGSPDESLEEAQDEIDKMRDEGISPERSALAIKHLFKACIYAGYTMNQMEKLIENG